MEWANKFFGRTRLTSLGPISIVTMKYGFKSVNTQVQMIGTIKGKTIFGIYSLFAKTY